MATPVESELVASGHCSQDLPMSSYTSPDADHVSIFSDAVARLDRSFVSVMALVIAALVIYGFSFTFNENLLHPSYPRPWILYVHALVFSAWIPFFLVQAGLIRMRRRDMHRRLGRWGIFFGALIPIVGVATAITMARMRHVHGEPGAVASLPIPLFDMIAFTSTFFSAAFSRRRAELHRRLMFMATCTLTAAAFGRMPFLDHGEWFYAGVDALLFIGVLRDLIVTRTVHLVYWCGLPAMILGQSITAYVRWSPAWIAFASSIFQ
jgi:hypothetical protein